MKNHLHENRTGIITLTTDFGLKDPYVAVMKGVILSICPYATLVDVSHDIAPGCIREAADILVYLVPVFPKGTIHVAVVDPGVGGSRRAIAVEAGGHFFVGPDNGIFWPIIEKHAESRIINLINENFFLKPLSKTFHGRDIFAPVAAYLANGKDTSDMGEQIMNPVNLPMKIPEIKKGVLTAEVIRVDRFGNLITNLEQKTLADFLKGSEPIVQVGNMTIKGVHSCYVDVPKGTPFALWGSSGFLEISVNCGKASESMEINMIDPTGLEIGIRRFEDV